MTPIDASSERLCCSQPACLQAVAAMFSDAPALSLEAESEKTLDAAQVGDAALQGLYRGSSGGWYV